LSQAGFYPVTFDNLSRGHADSVKWGPLLTGDIRDGNALDEAFSTYGPQAVIHFAAFAYVGESTAEPLEYYEVNVAGLIHVLKTARKYRVGDIVFSSSCATYGIPEKVPVKEDAPQRPISPYGRSKLMCEQVLIDAANAHGLRYAILRYFNASGADPAGELAERHDPETHLIPLAIDAAAGTAPPLNVFGTDYPTPDGTCERDYIHVTDLADAHVRAVQHLAGGRESLRLNIGAGRAHSIFRVLETVEEVVGSPVPKRFVERRPGDPPRVVADPTAAEHVLGFKARFSDLHSIVRTAWQVRKASL
jgi:UDP-arabinose 4-epimerase